MLINRKGELVRMEAVEVSDTATIKTIHVVRLIKDDGIRKTVIAEERYDKPVSGKQLLYCLAKYPQASFAVKEKIYVAEDYDSLPFN